MSSCSYREYFGPVREASFNSDREAVRIFDTDLAIQCCLIQTLIVCYEGVLYFHAPVEIDFPVVYVNVNFLIHLRRSWLHHQFLKMILFGTWTFIGEFLRM